jgi:hypothetical protein
MRVKKLDMCIETDRNILLTYFFKKLDTTLNKKELLTMSSIRYDSLEEKIYAQTKRFQEKLNPYKESKVLASKVDDTLKKVLNDEFRMQEELVRCDLPNSTGIDYFYITVIGVDFFLIEKELRE